MVTLVERPYLLLMKIPIVVWILQTYDPLKELHIMNSLPLVRLVTKGRVLVHQLVITQLQLLWLVSTSTDLSLSLSLSPSLTCICLSNMSFQSARKILSTNRSRTEPKAGDCPRPLTSTSYPFFSVMGS